MHYSKINSEETLQKLIALHPELLSNCDGKNPVVDNWLLIDREIGIPDSDELQKRWFLDHLFLDKEGIPTLVEVKLAKNTGIRREIVGQIIDYVTYFSRYWSYETIIAAFERRCARKDLNPDQIICNFLNLPVNASNVNTYWEQVRRNINLQKFRLIFAADYIPQELKDISSFLNSHMPLIEVKFIEMGDYVEKNPHILAGIKTKKTKRQKKIKMLYLMLQRTRLVTSLLPRQKKLASSASKSTRVKKQAGFGGRQQASIALFNFLPAAMRIYTSPCSKPGNMLWWAFNPHCMPMSFLI
jgi:hypothetical protein